MEEEFEKKLVAEVREDFVNRQNQRRVYDSQWRMNLNFLLGKQYCDITKNGELKTQDKLYDWQQQDAFNHIATIIESRHSKLLKIRPKLNVFPASNDPNDISTAETCKKMHDKGMSCDEIANLLDITCEDVEKALSLAEEL